MDYSTLFWYITTIVLMILLIVSVTVWNAPGPVPQTDIQQFSLGASTVSVPLTSVVDLVVQGDGTHELRNIYFNSWNDNNTGNCISVERVIVKGPQDNPVIKSNFDYRSQAFALPRLSMTTNTYVTFRIRFCTPVSTFNYLFND